MISIFVYKLPDNLYSHKLVADPETAMLNISDDKDFTLTPPPDYEHTWRWIDTEWVADNTAN